MALSQADINLLNSMLLRLQQEEGIVAPVQISFSDLLNATVAPVTLYVDATLGNDRNPGTSDLPFATIQAAVNKIPKRVYHPVTINVASGNYAGAYIGGFRIDRTQNPTLGAWIAISGTLITATGLSTGTATGTATSGTAGTAFSSTWGTLVDTGQAWTVGQLRGKLIEIISGTGSGQIKVIHDNDATSITIAGAWTAPAAASTYAIRDWGTIINTSVNALPTVITAAGTAQAGLYCENISGNVSGQGDIFVEKIKFTNDAYGIVQNGRFEAKIRRSCYASTSSSGIFLTLNLPAYFKCAETYINLSASSTAFGASTLGYHYIRVDNSVVDNGTRIFNCSAGEFSSNTNSFKGQTAQIFAIGFTSIGRAGMSIHSLGNIISGGAGCVAFETQPAGAFPSGHPLVAGCKILSDKDSISNCTTVANIVGRNVASFGITTGATNTTIFNASLGGTIQVGSGCTITGTTELSVDGTTSTLAAMRAATPKHVKNSNYFSVIYE